MLEAGLGADREEGAPLRGETGAEVGLTHFPHRVGGPCRTQAEGPAPERCVEAVEGGHEGASASHGFGAGAVEAELGFGFGVEIGEEYADFAKEEPGAVDLAEEVGRYRGEVGGVVGRHVQGATGAGRILGAAAVGVGFQKHLDEAGGEVLRAEFFGHAADVDGERLLQLVEAGQRDAKAAGATDRFFRWGEFFEFEAGAAAQFEDDTLAGDREHAAGGGDVEVAQGERGGHAEGGEAGGEFLADAPDVFHRHTRKDCGGGGGICRPDKNTGVGAGFFGQFVGEFGQDFGGGKTNADGDAGVALDGGADVATQRCPVGFGSEAEKGFVDGIDFEGRGEVAQRGHHPAAHVAIKGVVGAEGVDAGFEFGAGQVPDFTHSDAASLGFGGAGNDAAVVVGKDNDGLAFQLGLENAFAGAVERVAINEGEHGFKAR
jgi:hypothetical protein